MDMGTICFPVPSPPDHDHLAGVDPGPIGAPAKLDNSGALQHNDAVRFVAVLTVALALAWPGGVASAQEESPPSAVDDLLAEGWHLYSEELDFERAAAVYTRVVEHVDSTDVQLLEAYEYLAACRFALGDEDGARGALADLLAINQEQQLNDPSHPPTLLALLEEVRNAEPEPEPEPVVPSRPVVQEPDTEPVAAPDQDDQTTGTTDRGRTPWYRSWWFWTVTGVVVVGAVTVAVVFSVPEEDQPPPTGQLDPGVVQLPCTGIRF